MAKSHKGNTARMPDLSFSEKAKAVNAMLNNIQAAILHRVKTSPTRQRTARVCLEQVNRFRNRIENCLRDHLA